MAPTAPRHRGGPDQAIVCLHGVGRAASDWDGVRAGLERYGSVHTPDLPRATPDQIRSGLTGVADDAVLIGHSLGAVVALAHAAAAPVRGLVLTNGFFPPARNGRSLVTSLADYGTHRVAVLRQLSARGVALRPRGSTGRALGALARLGARPRTFHLLADAVAAPVLVVHGSHDHHVPVDFAMGAVIRHPSWQLDVLAGGHDLHVDQPAEWLSSVSGWLDSPVPAMECPAAARYDSRNGAAGTAIPSWSLK